MRFIAPSNNTVSRQPSLPATSWQKPVQQHVVVLTDDAVKAMFARATVVLHDGIVPVQGEIIGWKRTSAGCLGAIVINRLTGARFLYGPDLAKGGGVPRPLARLA